VNFGNLSRFLFVCALSATAACDNAASDSKGPAPAKPASSADAFAFRVPDIDDITDSAMRESITRGRAILEATRDSLPHNAGNSLRCTSCHLSDGTARNALPWVGVYSRYPEYSARAGHVETIEDRINDCFARSLNGRALGASTSQMRDIVAYMAFLSRGVPAGSNVDGQGLPQLPKMSGDTARGLAVFTGTCARCHGNAGQGTAIAPALWGPRSYNDGAGIGRVRVLASFVHEVMPLDKPRTLTAQQAYDVAAYIDSRPRPSFPARVNDWPNDPPPPDLGYRVGRGTHSLPR